MMDSNEKALSETISKIVSDASEKKQSKIGKKPAAKEEEKAVIFNNEILRKHVDSVMKAIERKDQANADVKSAYQAAEDNGVPKAELKFFIQQRKKRLSEDFKATVNIMAEMLNELPLFAFAEQEKPTIN